MTNRWVARVLLTLPVVLILACTAGSSEKPASASVPKATPEPPVAEVRPFSVQSPNGARTDEYYWLRDDTRTDKAVLGYLEAENAYTAAMTAHTQALEDRVYQEIVGRIQQDDSTVPYRKRGYWYYTRYEAGREHPVFARKAGTLEAPEQVMLNANDLARGHGFYEVGESAIAPNDRLLAYVDDTVGRRQYTLRFKDLANRHDPDGRDPERRTLHRLERRQHQCSVRREESRDAARLPGSPARAGHRSGARPSRLRAGRSQFLYECRHHQGRPLPSDRGREHGGERGPLRRCDGSGPDVSRLPAPRAWA